MAISGKSKKELIEEISALRSCLQELEHSEAERREAQDELRKSKEFLDNVVNALDDPFFVKDQEHRWFMLNDAACEVMGRPREELIGKSDYDLFAKEQAEKFWERDSFVLETGRTDLNEEEITWHGKLHTISTKKSLFTDSITGNKFITGTIRDITERKAFEKELKRSEETARAFLNATTDLGLLIDREGLIIDLNNRMARSLGRTRSDMIGTIIYDYMPPALAEQRKAKGLEAASKREPIRFEDQRENRWFENSVYPILDSKGEVGRFAVFSRDITERKQAEEALFKEKKFTEDAINAQMDTFFLFDTGTGKAIRWNKTFRDISGYTDGEIARMPAPASYYSPEDLERAAAFIQNVLKERVGTIELELICKDGRKVPTEYRVSIINDDQGEPKYIISIGRDITERKQAEEALREQREKAQKYLDVAEVIFVVLDTNGEVRLVNKKGCEVLGYKEEEIIGKKWFDNFLPERMKDDVALVFNKLIAGEIEPVEYHENPVLTKDGEETLIAWHNTILRDSLGNITGILSSGEDITECKKAEDALRQSEERFKILFESAPDAYYIHDLEGHFIDGNKAAEQLIGYSREEVLGENFVNLDLVTEEDIPQVRTAMADNKDGKPAGPLELTLYRKDGSKVMVETRSYPVEIGGQIVVLGIARDITERKRTQEKLLDYQGKLKSLASQLSLIEERERHRLATELHDQIGQYLVMSKMKLDSLRESISSGESTDVLGEVCDCLGDVIRDTRTLTFDLSSPILYELGFETAVTEWLDEQIREKHGIQTEFKDDGQPKPLDNDIRALLFRNVRELLINIVKHAKARKVKVSVSKVDEQICVIIEDDGVGFEPAKIGSNTGFGIFSIRERLEQLDGHLEIESEPGRGSRFTMTAPLKVEKSTEGVEV